MEDKTLENILRGMMNRAYDMGKKQKETPYKFTLDTDTAEKEWKEIKAFIKAEVEKALHEVGSYSIRFTIARPEADIQTMKRGLLLNISEYKEKNL